MRISVFSIWLVITVVFLLKTIPASGQTLSDKARLSILTMEQGDNALYDAFGHTMIRIQDSKNQIDWVYNYGIYDFEAPNFKIKFAQGKLLYRMRVWPFAPAIKLYQEERRTIHEQVLDLNTKELQKVFNFLQHNAKEENAAYYYDFFYDNCATRPMDVLKKSLGDGLQYNVSSFQEGFTHRDLLHSKLPWNSWGRFLTDLPIGAVVDRPIPPIDYCFLPEWAMTAFAQATLYNKPLVSETIILYKPQKPAAYHSHWLTSPFIIFLLIALFILYITYNDHQNNTRSRWFDRMLFLSTGVIGILLLLLWLATNHAPTKWNYNVLWAFPINAIAMFAIGKKVMSKWLRPYLKLLIIMMFLLTVHWIIGTQIYPIILIPIFIALFIRYIFILQKFSQPIK